MNKQEVREKIIKIVAQYVSWGEDEAIANALIAAGIGEVEQIVKERDELKVELRSKVDYIYEQDEIIKDYKRRAVVAEKAGRIIQRDMARVFDVSNPRICELIANIWDLAKKQAEKEL